MELGCRAAHPPPREREKPGLGGCMPAGSRTAPGPCHAGERDETQPQESGSTAGRGHHGLEAGQEEISCMEKHLHTQRDKPIFSLVLMEAQRTPPSRYKCGCQTPPLCRPRAWQEGEGAGWSKAAAGQPGSHSTRNAGCQARDVPANRPQSLPTAPGTCLLRHSSARFCGNTLR